MGCSERAEARKFMSVGYRVMLVALLMLVRNDARFKDLSINELDRALLWAVAPTSVFGRCTSVAAVKGGAPHPISTNTLPPPPAVPNLNTAHSTPYCIPSPPFPAADTTNWSEFTPAHAASPEL